MKRDKKIEVRVSSVELMQIKKHFRGANISDYIRTHLLEISKDCALDISNEKDLYELFKEFLSDEKVAKDIFTRFAKESDLGSFEDISNINEVDEGLIWYNGKQITYNELKKIEDEYKRGLENG